MLSSVPRSGDPARRRLERAALELYSESGYDQTTVADIAQRAGVTARTFFRHFADKREVLFGDESDLRERLAVALSAVPAGVPPLPATREAFRSLGPGLEAERERAALRHRIVATHPALQERELAKAAAMAGVIAEALCARGVSEWNAVLLGRVSAAALGHVVHTWAADPRAHFDTLIARAFDQIDSPTSS